MSSDSMLIILPLQLSPQHHCSAPHSGATVVKRCHKCTWKLHVLIFHLCQFCAHAKELACNFTHTVKICTRIEGLQRINGLLITYPFPLAPLWGYHFSVITIGWIAINFGIFIQGPQMITPKDWVRTEFLGFHVVDKPLKNIQ